MARFKRPVFVSQVRMQPSLAQVATKEPSAAKRAKSTEPLWLAKLRRQSPVFVSQMRAVRSKEAVSARRLSPEKQADCTVSWCPRNSRMHMPESASEHSSRVI